MRSRDALTRLAAAAPQAEALVDAAEEDRILDRILASPRPAVRRRPLKLVLACVAVLVAAAIAASIEIGNSKPSATVTGGRHHVALSGATFKLAGYHFKTPAGFRASDTACAPPASAGRPTTVLSRFGAAASADGGCVEALLLVPGSPNAPDGKPSDATPVAVGSYQGYFVPQGQAGSALYVELPAAAEPHTYLVLFAQGLTEDQLIAVARSGLPPKSDRSNRVVRALPVHEGAH